MVMTMCGMVVYILVMYASNLIGQLLQYLWYCVELGTAPHLSLLLGIPLLYLLYDCPNMTLYDDFVDKSAPQSYIFLIFDCVCVCVCVVSIAVVMSSTWLDYFPSRLVEVKLRYAF